MVSDTPALPSTLPSISSAGRTEPSSTSAMRCCFSSSVLCNMVCDIMSARNTRNTTPMGTNMAASRLRSSPLPMRAVGVLRV